MPPMPVGSPAQKTSGIVGSLKIVDSHVSVFKLAAKQRRQLGIGNEMKAARQIVARNGLDLPTP